MDWLERKIGFGGILAIGILIVIPGISFILGAPGCGIEGYYGGVVWTWLAMVVMDRK